LEYCDSVVGLLTHVAIENIERHFGERDEINEQTKKRPRSANIDEQLANSLTLTATVNWVGWHAYNHKDDHRRYIDIDAGTLLQFNRYLSLLNDEDDLGVNIIAALPILLYHRALL
jgi:hypothetical protein